MNSEVRHLSMDTERVNRRIRFIIKWSPLLLALAFVWLFFSLRRGPVSIPYVMACLGIGLLCGALIILDYSRKYTPLLATLWMIVFISAPIFLDGLFFPNLERRSLSDKMSYQYISTVLVSILGLVVIFRRRILKYIAQADVEQIVGPARGSRVL